MAAGNTIRRRNRRTTIAVGCIFGFFLLPSAIAFSTTTPVLAPLRGTRWTLPPSSSSSPPVLQCNRSTALTLRRATSSDDKEQKQKQQMPPSGGRFFSNFDPLYGGLWLAFLTYGVALSPGQVGDPADLQMILSYMDNPTSPTIGINPIFLVIFNGLGILPLILAQLSCPQGSSSKGLPALPFLLASMGMGFGAAGAYLTFRGPPVERKVQAETSWFTRNILENKFVSVGTIALLVSTVVSAMGIIMMDHDGPSLSLSLSSSMSTAVSEFGTLLQTSKLVSVSSLDLTIITIAAATLIPRDYQLRVKDNGEFGRQIAVGTLFFPILGAALYCLWRPSLPDE